MDFFDQELQKIKDIGLYRQLIDVESPQGRCITISGKNFLNFSSNNYLNLANDEILKSVVIEGVKKWGCGAGASRFISGNLAPYHELEKKIAKFKQEEDAIVFSSGYTANLGIITALASKDDVVFIDRLNHASIIDAIKLSGAKMCVYEHCNIDDLKKKISRYTGKKRFLVTDSVFSMDGDIAPLEELIDIAKENNLVSIVDEAHSFGVFGKTGAGLSEQLGLQGKIDVVMGTLSKAAGLSGGYCCGKKDIIDFIKNKSRSLIYTTAMPPAIVYGAITALDIIGQAKLRREHLWKNINSFKGAVSPIISILVKGNEKVLKVSQDLKEQGFFVPAIRFPTVKKGTERLRISLMSSHTKEDIEGLKKILEEFLII